MNAIYEVEYNSVLQCYVMYYIDETICLGATTLADAKEEAQMVYDTGDIQWYMTLMRL